MGNCQSNTHDDEDEEVQRIQACGWQCMNGHVKTNYMNYYAEQSKQFWPDGIVPYKINHSLDFNRGQIQKAMRTIEKYSRFQFVNGTHQKHFLGFTRQDGCYFTNGDPVHPKISIGVGCESYETILHELLHALGFPHEQRRPDRDRYITIHWQNIEKASNRNPMINEGFFEGDIAGIDPDQDRNAIPLDSQRWPNGVVPYVIDGSVNHIKDLILKSMRHIEQNSCIRFKERTNEHNHINIFYGNGCWSFWGLINTGEQKVSLGPGCDYFGTVVHEFLHALGFEHEHNRSDRDNYLDIHLENVDPAWHYAFKKLLPHENRLLTGFDYDSVMLYGQGSFAKAHGLKSMTAKDGRFMDEPYNKPGMSGEDIKRLKMLYQC